MVDTQEHTCVVQRESPKRRCVGAYCYSALAVFAIIILKQKWLKKQRTKSNKYRYEKYQKDIGRGTA